VPDARAWCPCLMPVPSSCAVEYAARSCDALFSVSQSSTSSQTIARAQTFNAQHATHVHKCIQSTCTNAFIAQHQRRKQRMAQPPASNVANICWLLFTLCTRQTRIAVGLRQNLDVLVCHVRSSLRCTRSVSKSVMPHFIRGCQGAAEGMQQ
jgi:hypothetical protein